MISIIKRDGTEVEFDYNKIYNAISNANDELDDSKKISKGNIQHITKKISDKIEKSIRTISVEEIQDMVEKELVKLGAYEIAKNYITYRYIHSLRRENNNSELIKKVINIVELNSEQIKQENSNKNPVIVSTQRDYIAGEISKDITKSILLDDDINEAHEQGIIHFHDSDYFLVKEHNCCLINLEDMLNNGTVISDTLIEKPKSFQTACNIATQITAQIASSQYGGQSISLTHLAPFVDVTRQKIRKSFIQEIVQYNIKLSEEEIESIIEDRVKTEVKNGVQTIHYQLNTLMTVNGQTPFITIFMYLGEAKDEQTKKDLALIIEEVVKQRYYGVKNADGILITPAFPKLIYVLEEDNIRPDSKYYYLTELCAKCTAKRLVPDYISEKKMKELKEGNCFPVMGCRSCLAPWKDEDGNYKFYGRFNQGVCTINLVDVALSSKKDETDFWKIFDERLELCFRALMLRHKRLEGTVADVAPIVWQYGGVARLKSGETIDKLLHGGYSSISLGFAGLYECVEYMTGENQFEGKGKILGISIMNYMNLKCEEWTEKTNVGFSVYGTPLESTTYKFASCLQKRFGIIEGITDRNYITNSYHYPVYLDINAFDKLKLESTYQELTKGGAISYVEIPNMQNNIEAVLSIMEYIYENIMYAELNTKSDYCRECGYDGEIEIVEDKNKKLIWKCPKCGNTDQSKMDVARRTCGYIGSQFWNQGRTQEIKERVLHL